MVTFFRKLRTRFQEEELKKEGGKYAHLNEDLHVLVEVYSEISDAYARLSHALAELSKFLSPVSIHMYSTHDGTYSLAFVKNWYIAYWGTFNRNLM